MKPLHMPGAYGGLTFSPQPGGKLDMKTPGGTAHLNPQEVGVLLGWLMCFHEHTRVSEGSPEATE